MESRIAHILIDLDGTLYPASSGLPDVMERRTNDLVAKFLGTSVEEAQKVRKIYVRKYGSTLKGLICEHGFSDSELYFENNHPIDVESYIQKNPQLFQALSSIPIPKSVLTNSAVEHAQRVIDHLGLREVFDTIFDLKFNDLVGKPNTAAYTKPLRHLSKRAEQVLFIDDKMEFLEPFRKLGGTILHLCEDDGCKAGSTGAPRITSLQDLPNYLGYQ